MSFTLVFRAPGEQIARVDSVDYGNDVLGKLATHAKLTAERVARGAGAEAASIALDAADEIDVVSANSGGSFARKFERGGDGQVLAVWWDISPWAGCRFRVDAAALGQIPWLQIWETLHVICTDPKCEARPPFALGEWGTVTYRGQNIWEICAPAVLGHVALSFEHNEAIAWLASVMEAAVYCHGLVPFADDVAAAHRLAPFADDVAAAVAPAAIKESPAPSVPPP